MRTTPTLGSTVRRVVRLACPACGKGRLFRRFYVRAQVCSHCGWKFERGEGYWVGGSEVHMFLSYGLSVLLFIPFVVVYGTRPGVVAAVVAGHLLFSFGFFRYSRAVFLGVDYWVDPVPDPDDGDDDSGDVPATLPPDPSPAARARYSSRAASSVTSSRAGSPRV